MLASQNRLKSEKDFERVKQEGRVFQSKNLGISVFNRKNDEIPRFGFVISTKISKLAVSRNRIRRALHEVVRHNLKAIPNGYDIVFLVKKSILDKSVEEIMREVESFLSKRDFKR